MDLRMDLRKFGKESAQLFRCFAVGYASERCVQRRADLLRALHVRASIPWQNNVPVHIFAQRALEHPRMVLPAFCVIIIFIHNAFFLATPDAGGSFTFLAIVSYPGVLILAIHYAIMLSAAPVIKSRKTPSFLTEHSPIRTPRWV
jgi:hypothetical protein